MGPYLAESSILDDFGQFFVRIQVRKFTFFYLMVVILKSNEIRFFLRCNPFNSLGVSTGRADGTVGKLHSIYSKFNIYGLI